MTCSHDIYLVRQCVLSVLCSVLLHHALHFLIFYLFLSHFTCSAHPSERKEELLVCHDIKKNEFKEYVGNAFFACVCVCIFFCLCFVLLLDFFLLGMRIG